MGGSDAVPALLPGAPVPPGGNDVVDWITTSAQRGLTVLAAIPPRYACYATVVIPDDPKAKTLADAALVALLHEHTQQQDWWLGYLDTGVADLPERPTVSVYSGWSYALVKGNPQRALTPRSDITPWHSALPELMFPSDRSWLVSTMWDDDWRCVGGSVELLDAVIAHPELDSRGVRPDEDATPPVHEHQ